MPYSVLLKEAHRLIDEMPEEKLIYIVKIIQQSKKKKISAEEVNSFLDKYGDSALDVSDASVLAMREALKNDVW